jgi:WhiB family transcriptional regulator, redox-sensing transcriptional regulator
VTDDASGDWRIAAACAGLGPQLFYDPTPRSVARAKTVCAGCAVRCACAASGVAGGELGVWGGLTADERRDGLPLRPGPPPTVDDASLVLLFGRADTAVRAAVLLRRHADLSRRTIYKYLGRAQDLGVVERRGAHLYPVGR